jgi:colanic acid biosynthesis glycosyl transferase WcaI
VRIQLWSYNYDPEPTGIGPVSKSLVHGLLRLGHDVSVVAAHPHYPEPRWGDRKLPYREERDGVPVVRLPLWIGRESALERYRQELSFTLAQSLAAPFLKRPDVLISASPSFPALLPAIAASRARSIPWVLWLHDILPDGATASGLVDEGSPVIRLSRRLESAAYRRAQRVVVLSRAFIENLADKGVPREKIELIYDPATRVPARAVERRADGPPRLLSMGNIGFSQGLAELIAGFEAEPELNRDVRLIVTGNGQAADAARAEIRTDRVSMVGLLDDAELEDELHAATVALVTQRHDGGEFNIPSKLMNFMAYGLPVLAAVNPGGEVARLIADSGAGWVVDSGDPAAFPRAVAAVYADPDEIAVRGARARVFAEEHFTQAGFAQRFDATLRAVQAEIGGSSRRSPAAT